MKNNLLVHGGWAAAVVVAFVAGHEGLPSPAPVPRLAAPTARAEDSAERPGQKTTPPEPPLPNSQMAIDDVRGRFFAALEEPNSLTRLRRTMDFYATLEAGSWETAYDAMTIETVQTGRKHDVEWRLLLQRSGEVGGLQAMRRFFKEGGSLQSSLVLTGWAAADPAAARAWVEALPAGPAQSGFLGDLVDGMVQRDPAAAEALLASLPADDRADYAGNFIRGTIQSGGYAAATIALDAARRREAAAGETKAGYTGSLFATLADRILYSNWNAKTPQAACHWIAEHAAPGDLQPELLAHAAGDWARFDPPGAFDWVSTLSAKVEDEALLGGVGGVVEQWVKKDANAVGLWLNANPDHPLRDQAAYSYAERVMKLDPAAAANWIEAIKDPALREQARQRLVRAPAAVQ